MHPTADAVEEWGGGRAAVADNLGGDALGDFGRGGGFEQNIGVGVRMGVNESRGDAERGAVNAFTGGGGGEIADGANLAARDADVGMIRRVANAVED